MATRYNINDFSLANPAYVGASVSFWTVSGGAKTTTLATLYAASTGSTTLTNPRTLDSDGKFSVPVYTEVPVIATVSGLTIADHDTGIMGLAEGSAATSAAAAVVSAAAAQAAQSAASASAASALVSENNAAATVAGALQKSGGNMTGGINSARGNITQHATTMDFFAVSSPDILDGTGSAVTITACVNAPQAGAVRKFYPIVATVLTHGATFDCVGNADLTAAAGDCWIIEAKTVSTYRVSAVKENGTAVSGSTKVNDFRLTLTSGTPVTTADVTGATTIYCTPYAGNQISLYDGSGTWNTRTSAEFSLALGTLTASLPYDVFCYDNAGTPTLEFLAWTSATDRATALVMQDGVLVKSGATTRRYLGTFYTASTTTTADADATRYLWNYYNRVEKKLSGTVSVDRSVASATYVEVNAEVQIKYVIGYAEDPMHFAAGGTILSTTANTRVTTGITIDSTSVAQAGLEATVEQVTANSGTPMSIIGYILPSIGYHYSTLIGMSESATSVSYIAATTVIKSKVYLTAVGKR
jgi:hypothetical protein